MTETLPSDKCTSECLWLERLTLHAIQKPIKIQRAQTMENKTKINAGTIVLLEGGPFRKSSLMERTPT